MLHARNDYNRRIQDSEGKIPDNEPVFMLRAQDIHAPSIVEEYAMNVEAVEGHDVNIVRNARAHAAQMRVWQATHLSHQPDMENADSVY